MILFFILSIHLVFVFINCEYVIVCVYCFCKYSVAAIIERYKQEQIVEGSKLGLPVLRVCLIELTSIEDIFNWAYQY